MDFINIAGIVDIAKDWWDKIGIIATVFAAVISFISILFIYFCSAIRADKIKEQNRQIEALNYLVVSAFNYLKYLFNIRETLLEKRIAMSNWLNNTNENGHHDNNDTLPFCEVVNLIDNFDVKVTEFSFSIKNYEMITNCLIKYLLKYDECKSLIKRLNEELLDTHSNNEDFKVRVSQAYINENRQISLLTLCEVELAVAVYRLFQIIEECKRYSQDHKLINQFFFAVIDEIEKIEEIKQYLDTQFDSKNWHIDIVPLDTIKNLTIFEKLKIFVQKIFSIVNSSDKTHKIITILGIKIKLKIKDRNENILNKLDEIMKILNEQNENHPV